jgi:hypothetical protein
VTFTGAVPGNEKPERYFMDKSGNSALYIYVRIKGSGVWRRIDFAAPWTPPASSTAYAYGSGTRGIWQNGNDLNLRVGDVNRDGKLSRGTDGPDDSTDEKYFTPRLGAIVKPTAPDLQNGEKSIYFYDYPADLNRDNIVDDADRGFLLNQLTNGVVEQGDF